MPRRGPRRAAHRILAVLLTACAGLMPMTQAHAAPSVDEIEKQIDKQWEQLEPTIEAYNKVHSQLGAKRKKITDLQKKIEPLSLQTAIALNRVGDLAVRYYKTGPGSDLNALLVTGDPGSLTEQLTVLDRLATQQKQEIASVMAARDKYNAEKEKLEQLVAQLAQQETELAAKKKQINAEIKRLTASLPKTVVKVAGCPTIKGVVSSAASTAIKTACAQVGDPYVWGATGPNSFDCSGLTQYAYKAAGIYLTHYTGAQWQSGHAVSRADSRPGDLVFFYSDVHHVGLYLGNGLMVHAPRTGKPVQVSSIDYQPVAGFRRVT
ncbi:C40 family peptidase [Plantactinospora sp. KBS50]|uniref:C40 family peptidase n=1 Tax=Plantactinospora sp. KBS50 TaxID=2024580 RepID=UPI000BAAF14A|nr:glycoside hydrolase [Plantactinospora sp. KBS50]